MFLQLIASRPARSSTAHGTTVSVVFHGALVTLAIIASAQADSLVHGDPNERVVALAPYRPLQPAVRRPAAPRPRTPRAEPVVPTVDPAPTLTAPTEVANTLPAPTTEPWTPGAPAPTGVESGTDPTATGDPSTPFSGALGAAEVDEAASLLPRSPRPQFPEALRRMGIAGGVRVRFVVGTDGRVEMETVRIIESTHPAFAAAVRSTLPRMRFRPARVGQRRVRQLVEVPIGFKLEP